MTPPISATIRDQIDELYRSKSRRVFASLVRLLKNLELADPGAMAIETSELGAHCIFAAAWTLPIAYRPPNAES
jgi:hypothetical protein